MNDIELINPYKPNIAIKNFTDLDEKLSQYYDYIDDYDPVPPEKNITPRGILGDFRSTSRDIFYYISWLYDNNPQSVLDFGCGLCYWKKWFPNIFGADIQQWPHAKIDLVIEPNKFISENQNKFDCGMALNSIHFGNSETVVYNIHNCMTLIKPKGRFLFTINMDVIKKHSTDPEAIKTANVNDLYNSIKNMPYNILLLDMPPSHTTTRAFNCVQMVNGVGGRAGVQVLNGHIRFILEKN